MINELQNNLQKSGVYIYVDPTYTLDYRWLQRQSTNWILGVEAQRTSAFDEVVCGVVFFDVERIYETLAKQKVERMNYVKVVFNGCLMLCRKKNAYVHSFQNYGQPLIKFNIRVGCLVKKTSLFLK